MPLVLARNNYFKAPEVSWCHCSAWTAECHFQLQKSKIKLLKIYLDDFGAPIPVTTCSRRSLFSILLVSVMACEDFSPWPYNSCPIGAPQPLPSHLLPPKLPPAPAPAACGFLPSLVNQEITTDWNWKQSTHWGDLGDFHPACLVCN